MKIQQCHIEDNGIGLGIIHDNGFIPISYSTGEKFQEYLETMLKTSNVEISYQIDCFENIEFTNMDGQVMLADLKKIQ